MKLGEKHANDDQLLIGTARLLDTFGSQQRALDASGTASIYADAKTAAARLTSGLAGLQPGRYQIVPRCPKPTAGCKIKIWDDTFMKHQLIALTACLVTFAVALCALPAMAVNTNSLACWVKHGAFTPSLDLIYEQIDGHALKLHIFNPKGFHASDSCPRFLVIHGGGWTVGSTQNWWSSREGDTAT